MGVPHTKLFKPCISLLKNSILSPLPTILKAVKQAEKQLWAAETTKSYVGTRGNEDFRHAMLDMMLGGDNGKIDPALLNRTASAQAAGGSGALRLGAEIIKSAAPDATVWVSSGGHIWLTQSR